MDSNWIRLDNNALELSALPFGKFVFEVRAIDRWANKSDRPLRMIILHPPPFWKSTWFTVLTYLLTAFLIGLVFYIFNRHRHRKKEEEYRLKRKMNDLEMMALRTQMDPHFIFNCLSSIQHHILKADTRNANLYLHKFSTLIRKILQYSAASAITLTEEIEMLRLYLDLEKMRLGDRMEHQIHITEDLRHSELYIPAMIIQPYVENAIRHGISPLREKKGVLRIAFRKEGEHIECSIEDNGIGINRSRQNKSTSVPGHVSMGTGNTESRISIFNEIHENKILLQIIDKGRADPLTTGTFVKLSFPIIMN
jgi:LytS/YehU family sensor histidine kinase